jgi:hypothetical protein
MGIHEIRKTSGDLPRPTLGSPALPVHVLVMVILVIFRVRRLICDPNATQVSCSYVNKERDPVWRDLDLYSTT